MKKIIWFMRRIVCIITYHLLKIFLHTERNYVLLAYRINGKDAFMQNTKYIFLYLQNQEQNKIIYLCDNSDMTKTFSKLKFTNIYKRNSLKGIYYTLVAKYCLFDYQIKDISELNANDSKSIKINLWHGIPLKKIEYDAFDRLYNFNQHSLINKIFEILKTKSNYYIVNSEYEQSCYETAFLTAKENIKILGSPRLDVLLHDIPHSDLFMEEDFAKIKSFKEQGKNLIFYTPTFRDTGKDISSWLKSDRLKEFLKQNNVILVCKLHFADKNSLDFELTEEFYKMDSNSDIYPVLKYSDALISDYSSIAFDYLLLDKPIIYHAPDLQEYQDTCRGFYMPYEEFAVGEITRNEEEILNAMRNIIDGVDNYKKQRKVLRDRTFKYQDGKNCERVVKWITSLDK